MHKRFRDNTTHQDFLQLQYNYDKANVPPKSIFNLWTQLIHDTLGSNAYAFSVDDAVGFALLDGEGLSLP